MKKHQKMTIFRPLKKGPKNSQKQPFLTIFEDLKKQLKNVIFSTLHDFNDVIERKISSSQCNFHMTGPCPQGVDFFGGVRF